MADVFISYHEDSAGELAEQIADALEKAGISCWYAKRDMPFGGNFAMEIPCQINACKLFLPLLNQEACQSAHIANEVALAFGRLDKRNDIKIFPLKIGEFQAPDWVHYFLALIQVAPFSAQPNAQQMNQVVEHITKMLNYELTQESAYVDDAEIDELNVRVDELNVRVDELNMETDELLEQVRYLLESYCEGLQEQE